MRLETPPSSVNGDDDIGEGIDEDDLLYIGDLDEVLEEAEGGENMDDDDSNESEEDDMIPVKDDALLVFDKHVGSVFCGSVHPTGQYAVTGGEDDKAFIWNVETGAVIFEVTQHYDSVVIASFSHDGVYLATADMSGAVRVLKCPAQTEDAWVCAWEFQAGDLAWGRWHPATRVLICGATAGEVYVWRIPSGDVKVLQGYGQKSECGVLLTDGRRLAVGYGDGAIKIWDIKTASVVHHIAADDRGHTSLVTAIDAYHDNNLIITGSADGKALLTKTAGGKAAGVLDAGSDVEALAFCKDSNLNLVAIGTLDGPVSIWDVSRQVLRHKCSEGAQGSSVGVTSLLWIKCYLATACLDGSVKIYEGNTGSLVLTLTGHRAEILDFSYSAINKTLLTTSEDGTCRIFKVDLPNL